MPIRLLSQSRTVLKPKINKLPGYFYPPLETAIMDRETDRKPYIHFFWFSIRPNPQYILEKLLSNITHTYGVKITSKSLRYKIRNFLTNICLYGGIYYQRKVYIINKMSFFKIKGTKFKTELHVVTYLVTFEGGAKTP